MTGLLKASPKIILLGALATLLSGCGAGLGDLQQFVQEMRSRPPGRIEPIPEFQPYQNFEYASHDLRDPFKLVDFRRPDENPEEINELASGLRPDIDRVKEPLEDFPLDTLRLKGTTDTLTSVAKKCFRHCSCAVGSSKPCEIIVLNTTSSI